jgi:ferredoxin
MNRRDFFKISGSFVVGGLLGGLVTNLVKRPKPQPKPSTGRPVSGPLNIRERCVACGGCVATCPADALELPSRRLMVYEERCIRCGNCVKVCPVAAPELL